MNTTASRNNGTSLPSGSRQRGAARPAAAWTLALAVAVPGWALAQGGGSDRMVMNATSDYRDMAVAHAKEGQQAPPRGGRMVYGHWTPYQPPSPDSYPPGSITHVIQKGQSLWGIAEQHYSDALLWPYLWESNAWILDPHWIYPGDTLLVPPLMTLPSGELTVSAGGLKSLLDDYVPAGFRRDYYCGMFIAQPQARAFGEIVASEDDPAPLMHSLNEVVYVNVGAKDGVLPGDEFAIAYPRQHFDHSIERREKETRQLSHPMTDKKLGYPVHMAGRLKIILLGEEVSTAQITYVCDAIEIGYDIYPFMEIPQPLVRRPEAIERYRNAMPQEGRGFIAYVADEVMAGTAGQLVAIDLGADEGVVPGDVFTIFRDTPRDFEHENVDFFGDFWDFREGAKRMQLKRDASETGTFGRQRPLHSTPPRTIGKLVVLYTQKHTATAKVVAGRMEVSAGDSIVIDPIGWGHAAVPVVEAGSGLQPNVPIGFQTGGQSAPMETFAPLGQ